ncbi:MAG TPA: hypothetical protein VIV60_03915, partial [Polyangiaceae bacterium]
MNYTAAQRILGLLRVLGLAICILAAAIAYCVRRAEAKLIESLRGFGDDLARLGELTPHSTPHQLMLNGVTLRLVTASTPLAVPAALDRFQSLCHTVGDLDLPATLKQKLQAEAVATSSASLGVLRNDTDEAGVLGCVDLGAGLTFEGFLSRLKEFGNDFNLKTLGQMRYAKAQRYGDRTNLVMFWTEGDMKLKELFPKVGDAPGRDLTLVPRPKAGQRLLSAYEEG